MGAGSALHRVGEGHRKTCGGPQVGWGSSGCTEDTLLGTRGRGLDALFGAAEVDVEVVEGGNDFAEGGVLRELGEGVDVLGEAFAAVAVAAVGAGDVGVGVVDVPGEEDAGVDGLVVAVVLAAVVGDGVEVGHLEGAEDVVCVFADFGLEGGHAAELFADEDLGEEVEFAGEDHGLGLEVFHVGALGEELGHEVDVVAGLF